MGPIFMFHLRVNVSKVTMPMNSLSGKIKKLGEKQRAYIGIIESNLNDIVSPFVHGLSSKLVKNPGPEGQALGCPWKGLGCQNR